MVEYFSGKYFVMHPEKVLGKIITHNPNTGRELTDQFGNPRPEVVGSEKDVDEGISIESVKKYDHILPENPSVQVSKKPAENASRIEKALKATEKERSADRSKLVVELKPLSKTIKEYNQKVEYQDENGETRYYEITDEEIKVWISYQVKNGLYDKEVILSNAWGRYYVDNPNWDHWLQQGLVAFDGDRYIPEVLYYAGNIYEQIRKLKSSQAKIVAAIGEKAYQVQLNRLEEAKPQPLLITEDESRKLHLSPFDKIWQEIEISTLADGQEVDGKYSIGSIFYLNFLNKLPDEDFIIDNKQTNAYQIYSYFIEKKRFPRGTSEQKKAAIRRNTTMIGQYLFGRFLIEALTRDDKNRIAALWNSKRNNYRQIQYHKIPVGFTINSKFKGGELKVRPAQREGVAFMGNRGTGIVAHDVGVGKTMTAILGISDGFDKGLFKRPLVVVPQKVIKKWIAETRGVFAEKDIKKGKKIVHKKGSLISEGILPHIEVIDYDNLGVNHIKKAKDENGVAYRVPAFSITFITYEGLVKIGFNQDTEKTLTSRLTEALSQGESGRGKAVIEQRAEEWIDNALKDTQLDIEEMGIDAIIVDEAHNFRNIFMDVKGDVGEDGERENKNFFSGTGSKPSSRALSLFMLNGYIQDKNNLRNTFGLTATPFTNRATEIYSMLSLYDYEGMKDFDCYNIAQFCTAFIDETMEDAWTAAGKFEPKAVIRGYNNLPTLQSLVFRSINYKTGEDANIQRPEKVILPLTHDENGLPLEYEYIVDSKLRPTQEQSIWMKEITMFASKDKDVRRQSKLSGFYSEDEKGNVPGQVLIALNASRAITFSPYALRLGGDAQYDVESISPEQFVKGSPKIQYAVECIRSVKEYHEYQGKPISGQVIYSDRGTEWFGHIKEYLIKNVGFSDKEVAVFYGKVSKGKREKIKEGFLAGNIKVIIGSSTMREGVDLQKYGSNMYICYIDWNPTDVHQLFGRIWRFGNKFSHVRLCVPLIENSSDIFTWQKLSEKMSRLNSIWAKSDGTKMFEESELNAEELKKGLINDPVELAEYEIEEAVQAITSELIVVESALKELNGAETIKERYKSLSAELELIASEALTNPTGLAYDIKPEKVQNLQSKEITDDKSMYRVVRQYAKMKAWGTHRILGKVDDHINYSKRMARLEEKVLKQYELTIFDNLSLVIEEYSNRSIEMRSKIDILKGEENKQATIRKYEVEKEAEDAESRTVEERVNQFQRLNFLLDCEFGIHNCDIYGRVEVTETGELLEKVEQEKQSIESAFSYTLPGILKKWMPKNQQLAIRGILKGDEGEGYTKTVLMPLEAQLNKVPKLYTTANVESDDKIIWAHFFYGSTDVYVAEWDGKDTIFNYTILNGDTMMAEWGYSSLREISKSKIELDFYWTPKAFAEVMDKKPNPVQEAIESLKLAQEFSSDDSIQEAIEALELTLEFA